MIKKPSGLYSPHREPDKTGRDGVEAGAAAMRT